MNKCIPTTRFERPYRRGDRLRQPDANLDRATVAPYSRNVTMRRAVAVLGRKRTGKRRQIAALERHVQWLWVNLETRGRVEADKPELQSKIAAKIEEVGNELAARAMVLVLVLVSWICKCPGSR